MLNERDTHKLLSKYVVNKLKVARGIVHDFLKGNTDFGKRNMRKNFAWLYIIEKGRR